MIERTLLILDLIRNMGIRYILFRSWYEIKLRSGILKRQFPSDRSVKTYITLSQWREKIGSNFFFSGNQNDQSNAEIPIIESLGIRDTASLKKRVDRILNGEYQLFYSSWHHIPDWHTHPITGHIYPKNLHWTEILDFSSTAGDIKYVWEKSRFTFLYDLIRYNQHFQADMSKVIFDHIENWIDENPVNCGPNWRCSQEISLRILNWTFAIHYYRYSENLTDPVFEKIINSIYQQILHVQKNIHFSRIAVRNNHAITETLTLYLVGLLYPFFPESALWKTRGKAWFEQEIEYQIQRDGTYLQFSMNYHRVVVQLLSWAIQLSELNGEKFNSIVYEKARKSIAFLTACQDQKTGRLPNYGNNDGALFFPLSECDYSDFRPQLFALAQILKLDIGYGPGPWIEESQWLGRKPRYDNWEHENGCFQFLNGGYYVMRDSESLTFLRCGNYPTRPFQADNLHIDVWVNGINIMRDAGSYLYNTEVEWRNYFSGTVAHNTVRITGFDQMRRGARFIWHDWIKKSDGLVSEDLHGDEQIFEGSFEGFRHLSSGIVHRRKVRKKVNMRHWEIEDWIEGLPQGYTAEQLWHPSKTFFDQFNIQAYDFSNQPIAYKIAPGWYSERYGEKTEGEQLSFAIDKNYIRTLIQGLSPHTIKTDF